jgi:8-oxo-dGTP pyrophosphatase MutT (NUDIX family)
VNEPNSELSSESGLPPARPAATVVVARPAPDSVGGLEVLLLERSTVGAFAGMWVFPGGRVDDADAGDDEVSRARSAAVREAREEVGVEIDLQSLIALSHWTPPLVAPKRFTTWFFVAPWGGDEIRIDGHEIVDSRWISPVDALAAGLPLAPPTHVTLATLAEVESIVDLAALIERRGVERFLTVPSQLDGAMVLLWEPDAGYATGDPTVPGARHRMTIPANQLAGTPQFYERSPE